MKNIRVFSAVKLVFLLSVCTILFSANMAVATNLMLTVGQQETVKAPDVARIAVGDPMIADVKGIEGADLVLVTAKGIGKTNLIIWDSAEKQTTILIEVIAIDPTETAREVRQLLGNIQGITVKPLGKKVVIDGYVLKKRDLEKIQKVVLMYPGILNLATLSPAVIEMVVSHINREYKRNGWSDISAQIMGRNIALEGIVSSELEKQKAEMIANAYYSQVINFIKSGVEIHELINVSVDFIELSNDDRTNVGIKWGDALSVNASAGAGGKFGTGNSASLTGTYGLVANYSVTMNMLKKRGKSRILARPRLLCRSGSQADFLAGGEVAIPIVTNDTTSVEYKEYGMILKISPTADRKGNIETAISIENSVISGFAANGAPNLHTSRVNTFVNGKDNQTIVLSGIVSSSQSKAVEKVPLLGEIPILGELFKSRNFKNDKSELLIFVTPTIVRADDSQMETDVQSIKEKYESAEDNMKFKIMD